MMNKVFNIGFSKTGTTSFEKALEILGYKVYHGDFRLKHNDYLLSLWIHRDFEEIKLMSTYWDAFADAPWGGTELYKELLKWYPDAKFVYTVRDSEEWFQSLYKMVTRYDNDPKTALDSYHANLRYGFTYFLKENFDLVDLVDCKDKIIATYESHRKETIDYFRRNNKELLIFNPIGNEGWNELCSFLGCEKPSIDYPHLNKFTPIQKKKITLKNRIINKLIWILKKGL